MTDTTRICVTATAEAALKKLKKAEIGVYDCKKDGTRFIFSVKDKHIKKVFAIFAKPCYNVTVTGVSRKKRLLKMLSYRAGLFVGVILFALTAYLSNTFIFKITVSGSGSYLSPEVKHIIYEAGAGEFRPFKNFDAPAATGKILALPQVTFCNIEKHGSVLTVDVEIDVEHSKTADYASLVSDRSGVVKNVVAICGTAQVAIGDKVNEGDVLIAAYTNSGDSKVKSLAAGYVELECFATEQYFAESESDESLKDAYALLLLYGDEILTRSYTVAPSEGGVMYVIEFTFLHKLSINIS